MCTVYGFIGVGHLASAVIGGMRGCEKFGDAELRLYDRNPGKAERFCGPHTVICADEADTVRGSDVVFVAVKPADIDRTLSAIDGCCDISRKVFVSTAAAVTTGYISSRLSGAKVVRTMPNTPISIGEGATAVCAGAGVTAEELSAVREVFSANGVCVELDESLMNKVIALNGSSPAYVFALINAMVNWAADSGIDPDTALLLAAQAVKGSADMVVSSKKSPQTLIDEVCSPGGTTIEAMKVLGSGGFQQLTGRAMDACTARADEMEKK